MQASMLKELGNNIICIDSTHKTTGYDFLLITLMVVDEFCEGFPVAWCLSTREDQAVLNIFFGELKRRNGSINPSWVMTDDAEQFYSCWRNTFQGDSRKLLCHWHVDRAWRSSLHNKIKDKEVLSQVYHTLRTLMEEENEEIFQKMLTAFCHQLEQNEETKTFADYFSKYYLPRTTQWALCHRKNSGVNTNMYLEAFHRTLKYILMRIANDKGFERLIKLEKGKSSHRITTIKRRHMSSLQLSTNSINQIDESTWTVQSSSNPTTTYDILKKADCSTCFIRCPECNVCIHEFHCSCPDSLINSTICKHVHLLKIATTTKTPHVHLPQQHKVTKVITELQSTSVPPSKESIYNDIYRLVCGINTCQDKHLLTECHKYITAAINITSLNIPSKMKYTELAPSTKIIEKQQPFSSKRKKRTCNIKLAKPTLAMKKNIQDGLLNKSKIHCSSVRYLFYVDILQLIVSESVSFTHSATITTSHLKQTLPDEIINFDLSLVRPFLDNGAWELVNNHGITIYNT
jgi:hypothetical protein